MQRGRIAERLLPEGQNMSDIRRAARAAHRLGFKVGSILLGAGFGALAIGGVSGGAEYIASSVANYTVMPFNAAPYFPHAAIETMQDGMLLLAVGSISIGLAEMRVRQSSIDNVLQKITTNEK
ncbi:MAG TPA: hypothetical protein VFN56_03635 [Candidatus Saccharimonadales bacterium]|nr:hypothetical protein [Candidatus Saccharimonadales bacterium]